MKCEYCGKQEGTLVYKKFSGNFYAQFYFCESCYAKIMKAGIDPFLAMLEIEEVRGKVCNRCGCTVDEFKETLLFGCPDCYLEMRELAENAVSSVQRASRHKGKTL